MSNQPDQQEETIPMQDTPVPPFFAALTAAERAQLFTDAHLGTLPGALAAIPDPRKRRGQRYDLPFLLTCLGAAAALHAHGLALAPPVAAPVGRPRGARAGQLGPADAPGARPRAPQLR